jgi:hypothetical protein
MRSFIKVTKSNILKGKREKAVYSIRQNLKLRDIHMMFFCRI